MLRRLAFPLAAALCAAAAVAGPATALEFTPPAPLPESLPSAAAQRGGGEPSAIFDPGGSLLYVASPGAPDHGGNFWRSTNAGATLSPGLSVGSAAGGGDSDLALGFDPARTLFYIDLEDLAASDLCRSTDQGQSFPDCSTGFPPTTNQQEPVGDRPWLNTVPGRPGLVYGTYDGLAYGGGAPEVQQSTDNGTTFANCGQVLEPGSSAFAHFSPTGAAENSEVIGKPAVGPDGTIYVPFTEPHAPGQQASSSSDPTRSNLYLGVSRNGCPPATSTFHDTSVWENDQGAGSDFVSLFPSVAVDGAGTVYVLGTGQLAGEQKGDGVYLFISHDGGRSFPTHTQVNQGPAEAAQLAALDVGKTPGDVLVGWYASQANADHNSADGRWRYFAARSSDGGQTFPARTTVTPDVMHYGAVCNVGTLCTSGRNLLDFTTVAINPVSSCAFAVFAGDPFNTPGASPTSTAAGYTALQNDGACAASAAPAPGSSQTGAAQGSAAARPALRLAVTPRSVTAGRCRRYTFHVTTRTAGRTRNVAGATVRYAGGHGRTSTKGITRFTRCVKATGRHTARATRAGYTGARASVLARRAVRARVRFTG